jgi:hypothetical protein
MSEHMNVHVNYSVIEYQTSLIGSKYVLFRISIVKFPVGTRCFDKVFHRFSIQANHWIVP